MSESNDDTGEYKVGYGKPPKATQFKKGQSGNKRGRPRKAVSQRKIAEKVLGEKQRLTGQPRGAKVHYTTLELIVMTLKQLAASGHHQATRLFTRVLETFGTQHNDHEEVGYLVIPERLTAEEWEAKHEPKDVDQGDGQPT